MPRQRVGWATLAVRASTTLLKESNGDSRALMRPPSLQESEQGPLIAFSSCYCQDLKLVTVVSWGCELQFMYTQSDIRICKRLILFEYAQFWSRWPEHLSLWNSTHHGAKSLKSLKLQAVRWTLSCKKERDGGDNATPDSVQFLVPFQKTHTYSYCRLEMVKDVEIRFLTASSI